MKIFIFAQFYVLNMIPDVLILIPILYILFFNKKNRIENNLTVVQRNNVMIMKIHSRMQSIICNYPIIMP